MHVRQANGATGYYPRLRVYGKLAHRVYDEPRMKPAPSVPGETEAERMKNAVRIMFSVPKDAYLKEEARLKRVRGRKRATKKPA
jgi:hypothetical protein